MRGILALSARDLIGTPLPSLVYMHTVLQRAACPNLHELRRYPTLPFVNTELFLFEMAQMTTGGKLYSRA